jgi:hypothetical protein
MKLPKEFLTDTGLLGGGNNLSSCRVWVLENKPSVIEMTEHQFWQFVCLQPLHAGEERYWTTFCGVPIICPEMTETQQINLKFHVS